MRSLRLCLLLCLSLAPQLAHAETTAFFYSSPVPRELFEVYDQVVVQPDQAPNPGNFVGAKGQPVAYVSVGEVLASSQQAQQIQADWVIARNAGWSTWVLDPRSAGYQSYLLSQIDGLWARGYRRFFLDTLDSYRLGLREAAAARQGEAGWVRLIRAIRERHPEAKLLLNRGFELLPDVASLVSGVVAESLFDGYDAHTQSYVRVSAADQSWLLGQLNTVRDRYKLPVTVVDYRPRTERAAARTTAQRIAALGFEPWVADGLLQSLGVGSLEVLPRKILLLTDDPGSAEESGALELLGPVIEYLGYVPVPWSLSQGLPASNLVEHYAGLVTWFGAAAPQAYGPWLLGQLRAGLRVAILGNTGFAPDGAEARELGIQLVQRSSATPTVVVQQDALIGFEASVPAHPFEGPALALSGAGVTPHLTLSDSAGHVATPIATSRWGGLATSHLLALRSLAGERAWVLDPFAFLSQALALPRVPEPDLTTQNGCRIALFLIRAAGLSWPARWPGSPPTLRLLNERILARYPWPHGLDVGVSGAGPAPSDQDLAAARQLSLSSFVYPAHGLLPGSTDSRRERASLTRLRRSARGTGSGLELIGPIASDLQYLPPNGAEAYPFARVRETLEYTESPRRLTPILLDYHAFLASSPGGLATLDALYAWVASQQPYWLDLGAYRALVEAFREQSVARHLDGSISYHGGEALRTVRVPYELGSLDLRASQGVAVFRQIEQAQYLSFGPAAERRIVFAQAPAAWPHLTDTNGRVRALQAAAAGARRQLDFELDGTVALHIGFGGLGAAARCRLELTEIAGSGRGPAAHALLLEGSADQAGGWQVSLAEQRAVGHLSCVLPEEPA
jgi:hypothetical protein